MPTATYDSIIVTESSAGKYVTKPTEESIAECESLLACSLPASYRTFSLRFGAGVLASSFRIYAPMPKIYKYHGSPVYGLLEEHSRVAAALTAYRVPKQKTQFCVFATGSGGEMYVWNTLETTKPKGSESRIYQAIHPDEVYPFAKTFDAFVKLCCMGKVTSSYPLDDDEQEENWTFSRFQVPPKR